jgi:tetratricopeptide (TPR) repeat protein/DNA-binding CsgD family transcriptional regulator
MGLLGAFSRRTDRPASLQVKNGDAFAACAEKLGITSREGEIVRLLLEGKDSKQITEELFISDHTVKNHIHHVYQKLGVKNRIQLVRCFQSVLEDPGRPPGTNGSMAGGETSFRRAAIPAAVLLIILALMALVAWRPWGLRPRPAAFPPTPALAVLDFENLSVDPELEKWVTGLPLLLATDLAQSKHIRAVSDDTVYGALRKFGLTERRRYSSEELRRLAKEMKADYLISGSLMAAGGKIVVTAALRDARTGAAIRTEKLDCQDEKDLMLKADGLARLIRSSLNRSAAQAQDDIDLDIEVLTTSSALAYKYYAEGWRYHRTGDYEQALTMLNKAVEIDPEFAMAYRMMAAAARNLGYSGREAEYHKKAFDLAARLPENCRERHLIRADYYGGSEATLELAVIEYKKVLEEHPYDIVANNNLAMLCGQLEDYEASLKYAEVPIREGTSNPFPYYTRAESLWGLGRYREAVRGLVAYHEDHPANRLIYQVLISALIEQGDVAGAEAALEKAVSVFPDPSWASWKGALLFRTEGAAAARQEFRRLFLMDEAAWRLGGHLRLALIGLATGRYSEAEKECRDGAELAEKVGEPEWSSDFRRLLGHCFLEGGRRDDAIAEFRAAVERAGSNTGRLREALLGLGRAQARAGDLAAAEDLTRQFRTLAQWGAGPQAARALDFFLALLELEKGRPREAAAALEKAIGRLPPGGTQSGYRPSMYYHLGLALERAGDPAGATEAYDEITGSDGDRFAIAELFPLAVLGRARAQEALGHQAAAVEGYRSFLALWVDADPGRPEVDEARARLKALSSPSGSGR